MSPIAPRCRLKRRRGQPRNWRIWVSPPGRDDDRVRVRHRSLCTGSSRGAGSTSLTGIALAPSTRATAASPPRRPLPLSPTSSPPRPHRDPSRAPRLRVSRTGPPRRRRTSYRELVAGGYKTAQQALGEALVVARRARDLACLNLCNSSVPSRSPHFAG